MMAVTDKYLVASICFSHFWFYLSERAIGPRRIDDEFAGGLLSSVDTLADPENIRTPPGLFERRP